MLPGKLSWQTSIGVSYRNSISDISHIIILPVLYGVFLSPWFATVCAARQGKLLCRQRSIASHRIGRYITCNTGARIRQVQSTPPSCSTQGRPNGPGSTSAGLQLLSSDATLFDRGVGIPTLSYPTASQFKICTYICTCLPSRRHADALHPRL